MATDLVWIFFTGCFPASLYYKLTLTALRTRNSTLHNNGLLLLSGVLSVSQLLLLIAEK